MILRYAQLAARPKVFESMTGLRPPLFDEIAAELAPRLAADRLARRDRPGRDRAPGAGHPFELDPRDALLLTVVWLRHYPTCEVLGYLFGVSKATASRMIREALPLLEAAGRDTMRLPEPGRQHRRRLPEMLRRIPGLGKLLEATAAAGAPPRCSEAGPRRPAVFVDSFEQAVQRPTDRAEARRWFSGKKKAHTIKSQVAVDESGRVVAICGDAVGPFSDLTLLAASGLARRLDPDVDLFGDGAYLGMAEFRTGGLATVPRRDHQRRRLTDEDREFNREISRRRIVVEHTIGRLRTYRSLADRDRHHRKGHQRRVIAVAGLINRRMDYRAAI